MAAYYDVMIIDENPINVLFENEVANGEELAQLRDMILYLNLDHPDVNVCISLLNHLITNFVGKQPIYYPELLALFTRPNYGEIYEEYQSKIIDELRFNRIALDSVPKEFLPLFNIMRSSITDMNIEYMIVKKNASPYNKKKYHFMTFDNSSLLECPIKIIGLDGTANPTIWEAITSRRASILERSYVYKNIIQLRGISDARYPLSSWVRHGKITSSGLNLCKLIDAICKKKKAPVLVACTKPLQYHIYTNTIAKNIMFCNYYYVRSRNDFYEKCDTIILACEPNIQQFQIECFSKLSNWNTEIWREVFTQEEMIQTVGRIREDIGITILKRRRDSREIFIFPYTNPTNKPGDDRPLYSESRIMNYNDILTYIQDGLMPEDKMVKEEERVLQYIEETMRKKIYTNEIIHNLKFKRNQAKPILKRLARKGVLIEHARGWETINNRIS